MRSHLPLLPFLWQGTQELWVAGNHNCFESTGKVPKAEKKRSTNCWKRMEFQREHSFQQDRQMMERKQVKKITFSLSHSKSVTKSDRAKASISLSLYLLTSPYCGVIRNQSKAGSLPHKHCQYFKKSFMFCWQQITVCARMSAQRSSWACSCSSPLHHRLRKNSSEKSFTCKYRDK